MKALLRWILLLPVGILTGVIALYPLRWGFNADFASFGISPPPELIERLLIPFVFFVALQIAIITMAPKHKKLTGLLFLFLHICLVICFSLYIVIKYGGYMQIENHIITLDHFSALIVGIIGSIVGFLCGEKRLMPPNNNTSMKAFFIHLCLLIPIVLAFVFVVYFYAFFIPWLCEKRLVGTTWISRSGILSTIGIFITLILWLVGLIGFRWCMHLRFRAAVMIFGFGILGLVGGTVATIPPGIVALFFYSKGLWFLALPFRIIEILLAIAVLIELLVWIFGIFIRFLMPLDND